MDNRSYYDTFANTYEDKRHEGYHVFLDEAEMAVIGPHIAGKEVLEVGCGTGLILNRIAKTARRAVGIDLSPGMLEHARRRGLEVHEASATELPFDDNTFDVAVSFKVLAHVENIGKAMAEMARVVRPGGRIIAEFYNSQSVRTLVKRLKPDSKIGGNGVVDTDVYTRYDSLDDVKGYLPGNLELVHVDGIRIAAPMALPFNLPVVGPLVAKSERLLMKTPLRRFGGFMVVHAVRR